MNSYSGRNKLSREEERREHKNESGRRCRERERLGDRALLQMYEDNERRIGMLEKAAMKLERELRS